MYAKGNTTIKQIQHTVESTSAFNHAVVANLQQSLDKFLGALPADILDTNPYRESLEESFQCATQAFHHLETEHQRLTYLKSKGLILPTKFKIGTRRNVVASGSSTQVEVYAQYVSIIDTLIHIKSKSTDSKPDQSSDMLFNYESTKRCKNDHYYMEHPGAVKLMLYFDDIEIANPLGSKAGLHKLTMFYIAVDGKAAGKLHSIYLALVCHSSDLPLYGYSTILRPLIQDLHDLNHGVPLTDSAGNETTLYARLEHVIADNLAANQILGLVCSFSRGYNCRFCYIDSENRKTCSRSLDQLPRSAISHQVDVELSELSSASYKNTGVKMACALDELEYFSAIEATVPDIM